jgi:hypothetical protein
MDPIDLPIELEYLSEEEKRNNYKIRLQSYIRQLNPTGYLVGKKGSYRQDELFKIREKIETIESNFASDFNKNKQFNNNHEIRLLISNIEQIILAYESLMNNTARELNIKIFNMPWDKIISGEIDLANPFTVSRIGAGRTKKRRNKRRRTQRRKRTYK